MSEVPFDIKRHVDDLLFLPLGGSAEVTMNCNLYYYEGKWIIIDMGIAFAKDIPGVQVILPDINFIKKNIKDFLGIFITHAHEDHIGAIQYLWQELKLPIYASKFASVLLRDRLINNCDFSSKIKIIEFPSNGILNVKPFTLEFISLTHSIPEMNAILVRTNKGNILHTGDWRFEEKPIIGIPSNKKRLKELGDRNTVLAMVCESTNIFNDNPNKNETDLLENLKQIVSENNTGLIVAGVFATNISRIVSLAIAARASGRKVGILGSSIHRTLKVAIEMHYLPRDVEFVKEEEFPKIDKKKLFIIATGCQGQENSGMGRLADDTYKFLKLEKNDIVLFSASEIPGNETEIYNLYNKYADREVKIINTHNAFVHISGHYTKSELIEMYQLVKPKVAITTHGDAIKLVEHKRIAEELGIKSVIRGKNGAIFRINIDGTVEEIGNIKTINSVMDGKRKMPLNSSIISERRKMQDAGIIIVNFIIDKNFKLLSALNVFAIGNYNFSFEKAIYEKLREIAYKGYKTAINLIENLENKERFDTDTKKETQIEKEIKKGIDAFNLDKYGKHPLVVVKMIREQKMINTNINTNITNNITNNISKISLNKRKQQEQINENNKTKENSNQKTK
jgi:ribonuclease J